MLAIRYLRSGRTNQAFFRIVLTESSKPPKSGFISVLGWYNPHTKENSLNKEEIIKWLDNGAQASNSVARLLNDNGIKHKQAKFKPDAPKKSKKAEETPKQKPSVAQAEPEAVAEEIVEAGSPAEETPAEVKKSQENETAPEETPEAPAEKAVPAEEAK